MNQKKNRSGSCHQLMDLQNPIRAKHFGELANSPAYQKLDKNEVES
jgi:hypothetical protein